MMKSFFNAIIAKFLGTPILKNICKRYLYYISMFKLLLWAFTSVLNIYRPYSELSQTSQMESFQKIVNGKMPVIFSQKVTS